METQLSTNFQDFPIREESFRYPAEEQSLSQIGTHLEALLPHWNLTLIPTSSRISPTDLRKMFPTGPLVVCDAYVEGIETGESKPWGYEKDGIINIDHHAPTPEMSRTISSGILAGRFVRAHGPLPENVPLIINHTDCDSITSALVVRGLLPVHTYFEEAVIAADHTGLDHRVANLLQALEDSKDPLLCATELVRLLKNHPHSLVAQEYIEARQREFALAKSILSENQYRDFGEVVLIQSQERIGSDLFLSLFPEAILMISCSPMGQDNEGQNLWETKLRLGSKAPEGLTLSALGAREFDPYFGGRWNAGSTSRSGGTTKSPDEYLAYYLPKIRAQVALMDVDAEKQSLLTNMESCMNTLGTNENESPLENASVPLASSEPIAEALPALQFNPGVGATEEYSLRVSTAVLGRVHFTHPDSGVEMLLLERKCTSEISDAEGKKTKVNAQPLGGASILANPQALWALTGGFHYDTEKSKKESDFRLQIRTTDWPIVRDFCVEHFARPESGIIEADISRELEEEFGDALGREVNVQSFATKNVGIQIQEEATQSERLGVSGAATCRVFNIQDVEITDPELIRAVLKNSDEVGNEALIAKAEERAAVSAKRQGKATALIALPRSEVESAFAAAGSEGKSVKVGVHKLITTVGISLAANTEG